MIPTALTIAFIGALFVPRRWVWFVGVVVAVGAIWVGFILWAVDDPLPAVPGAFLLGAANAAVGAGLSFGVRWIVATARHKDAAEPVKS